MITIQIQIVYQKTILHPLLQDLWRWHQIVPVHRIQNARVPHCLRVKVHSSQQMANKRRLPCSVITKNKTTLIKQ